jgi:hypothetical protein
VEISYAVVECFNNEFSVASGEIQIASGNASNTATISSVDTAKSLVIVNARTDVASTSQYEAHVTGELTNATTVQVARSAAATGANTFVTYQVVEFSAGSAVSIQTGEITLGTGTSITDTLGAAVDQSSSWLYFSYDATDDGPQQTAINGQITAPSVVTFARHANNAYTNRIRYYVVEFPVGEVTVQTGSSTFNGGATTHNIGFGGVAAINKAFTFVSNSTLDVGGGGGGAPLNQTDDFAGLADGTRPNFGNWTGVNGSDGTMGWVVLSGATGSGSTGPTAGNPDPYVYLESSASSQTYGVDVTAGSSQYIESNVIDAGAYTTLDFTFDWNMNVNQNTDASLHLDAWNGTSWDLDITGGAINTGNNGDTWVTTGPVDLSSYSNADFQLRIRYIVGSAGSIFHNDVAVDNLVINGVGGSPTAYPINRWTEVLSSTSNIQLVNGRGTEADSNASMQWQVVEFTGSGPILSAGGSDMKVDTHHSPLYGGVTQDCVTCHNPMYAQSNYRHIRSTINGATIVFGTPSTPASPSEYATGTGTGLCEVCHTQNTHYVNAANQPAASPNHNIGSTCTTSGCHVHIDGMVAPTIEAPAPHNETANPGLFTTCDVCHVANNDFVTPIPDSKCLACHDGVTAILAQTHGDGVNPPRPYTYSNACITCHNPMYDQSPNTMFIRTTLAVFDGTSYIDGAAPFDDICETCHTQTTYHRNNSSGDHTHNAASACTSSAQ